MEGEVLTEVEITNVAKEINGNVDRLAKELEMEYSIEQTRLGDCSPAYSLISKWAILEGGTRCELAQYLIEADLHLVAVK